MPHFALVALFIFLFTSNFAQVYHYETGKAIPVSKPGQIVWKSGVYLNYPADFGTLVQLENSAISNSKWINIPVIKITCTDPDSAKEPIFVLNGGPGESNIQSMLFFPELIKYHDIILVGYRGVDGSVKLKSDYMKNALLNDTINSNNANRLFTTALDSTLIQFKNERIDIRGYSILKIVEDIETVRSVLNYEKIIIFGFSYGTMIAQEYYLRNPNHIKKAILIGARPKSDYLFDYYTFNRQYIEMFKYLNENDFKANWSDEEILGYSQNTIDKILFENKQINSYRFLIFTFSRFYSIETAKEYFNCIDKAHNNNSSDIINKYQEFYKLFPTGEALSDLWIKKQGCVAFSDLQIDSTFGSQIIKAVNNWYTPQVEFLQIREKNSDSLFCSQDFPLLFVSGELDLASPPIYLNQFFNGKSKSTSFKLIGSASHMDLLNKYREKTLEYIEKFLQENDPNSKMP